MTGAVVLVLLVVILIAAAVAWRLSTERVRPPLPDYSTGDWPTGLHGDVPALPADLKTFHSAGSTAGDQHHHA